MADYELSTEIEGGWDATESQTLPLIHRSAKALKRAKHRWFDRLMTVLFSDVKQNHDVVKGRVLWTPIPPTQMHQIENSPLDEIQAAWANISQHAGHLFRHDAPKPEAAYFQAEARLAEGQVDLFLVSDASVDGDVSFSVGVSDDLDGPYVTYQPNAPLTYDADGDPVQVLSIPTADLTVGHIYYYRIWRDNGITSNLGAPVLVIGARSR